MRPEALSPREYRCRRRSPLGAPSPALTAVRIVLSVAPAAPAASLESMPTRRHARSLKDATPGDQALTRVTQPAVGDAFSRLYQVPLSS